MTNIRVKDFIEDQKEALGLTLLGGKSGIKKMIELPQPQKPGLALISPTSRLASKRLQVFGKSEINYLKATSSQVRQRILKKITESKIPVLVISKGIPPPDSLLQHCNKIHLPILTSTLSTNLLLSRLGEYLSEVLQESTIIHGVLVSVMGMGILIIGKSGIGKSECALDLIARGHQFIADDVVEIVRPDEQTAQGMCSKELGYHMEVRGIGVINIQDLFGVAAVRPKKIINLIVEMVEWVGQTDIERLGASEQTFELMNVKIPYLKLPVSPARHLATLIEVAARNLLLQRGGKHTALEFSQLIDQKIMVKAPPQGRRQ